MKTLETKRLLLRAWRAEDAPEMFAYASDPRVGPPAGWKPHQSIEETRAYLAACIAEDECWAIVWKETNVPIGSIGLHPVSGRPKVTNARMLGYVLHPDHWHKGVIVEASRAVMRYAFEELSVSLVTVMHFPNNIRSKATIARLGFRYEGLLSRAAVLHDGSVTDELSYSMTAEEWRRGCAEKHRYAFVQNTACEYFPCHRTEHPEYFNCLFCYCPLYTKADCKGNYTLLPNGTKDCSACLVPHHSYEAVLNRLLEKEEQAVCD